MISAILVDDEVLTVEALKKIINSNDSEINIVGQAYDGAEALEKIQALQPDLAIVDIRMPHMDGLELMKIIKEKALKTNVIVISAYRDFEYAQQAIQFGAFGYLVKPVDKVKLLEEISNVRQRIYKEKNIVKLNDIVNESMPLVKEKYFKQLLAGNASYSEKDREDRFFPDIDADNCQLMLISFMESLSKDFGYPQNSLTSEQKVHFIEDLLRKKTKATAFYTDKGEIAVIINGCEGLNEIEAAHELINSLKQVTQLDINIALSSGSFSLYDIGSAYREARISLIYKFYLGLNSVIAFDKVKEIQFPRDSFHIENEDNLIEQIKLGLSEEVLSIFNKMYVSLRENMSMNPKMVYIAYYEFILYLKKALKDTNVDNDIKYQLANLELEHLQSYQTLEQLTEFIRDTIIKITSYIENSRKSDDSRFIEKVRRYCEENYSKDITLDLISEHVNMTKNYFCSLFKKKAGESFWDYLTGLRINKAKVLLETTEIKINVISEKVGYKNSSHFCRIFKETVGVSPAEYKQRFF